MLEEVEGRKDLPVVGYKGLPYHRGGHHQLLQHLQYRTHHTYVAGIEGTLKRRKRRRRRIDL